MKARASDNISTQNGIDAEMHDLSILRKPIQTTVTGFHEAMKAYQDGTEEIKKLLANECDIIYECKTCRNIFRSLANFISHKRIYCTTTFNSANHFHFRHGGCIEQDISTIIQVDQDNQKNSNQKIQERDLGSIIDRLVKRKQNNRLIKLNDVYEQANHNLSQDEVLKKKHEENILQLDRVTNTNSVAVFQTIIHDRTDDIKKEVSEVHDLMQKDDTVLGPDGKVLADKIPTTPTKNTAYTEYQCKICSYRFTTEKTLKLHIQAKHISSTYVYPCPSCSQTFMQPSAVIRHLSNDHKKSMRRIRLMRDAIFRRRTRVDEIPIKGPSRELTRLQNEKDRAEQLTRFWQNSSENSDVTSSCKYCRKPFERRAALLTHLKSCLRKPKPKDTEELTKESSIELSESMTNFLEMLDREKQIQQSVENSIAEENVKLQETATDSDLKTTKDENTEQSSIVKNKRKQNRTRKAEQTPMECETNNLLWNANDDDTSNVVQIKSEPKNDDNEGNTTAIPVLETAPITIEETPTIKTEEPPKISPERTTDCTICSRKFANISNLRRHVAMYHYRQKKYGCKLCDNKAFRKFDIVNHLASSHSIANENDEALAYIDLLKIDKNKFSEEKAMAVADALLKLQAKQEKERPENHSDDSVQDDLTAIKDVKDETHLPDSSNENSNIGGEDDSGPSSGETTKKRGRPRLEKNKHKSSSSLNGNDDEFVVKSKLTKLSRNSSSNSLSDESHTTRRRPVRNRVKAVNKDFVYDLSNLLKKENDLYKEFYPTATPKIQKRKMSTNLSSSSSSLVLAQENGKPENVVLSNSAIKQNLFNDFKGAANTMAKLEVLSGRACLSQPPEIPLERPIVPSKIQYKSFDGTIQDFRQLQQERSIVDSLAQKQKQLLQKDEQNDDDGKITVKRRRLSKKSIVTLDNEENIETKESLQNLSSELNNSENSKILVKCPTDEEFTQLLLANKIIDSAAVAAAASTSILENIATSTPTQIKPSSAVLATVLTTTTPSTNSKRITLLQRLAENKTKKMQENLLQINLYGNGSTPPS